MNKITLMAVQSMYENKKGSKANILHIYSFQSTPTKGGRNTDQNNVIF